MQPLHTVTLSEHSCKGSLQICQKKPQTFQEGSMQVLKIQPVQKHLGTFPVG